MTRDRAQLQRWYRQAMRGRVDELRGLGARLSEGDPKAAEAIRQVGMALRGSGATFGFPLLTRLSALVETARDDDLLRRSEGLIAVLERLAVADDDETVPVPTWLLRAAGLVEEVAVAPRRGIAGAWSEVARRTGCDHSDLAKRVADVFGLEVADLSARSRAALRLVPEALVTSDRVVPLREDSDTITVATSDPTALATELELEELTGRRPVFVVAPPEALDAIIDGLPALEGTLGASGPSPGPSSAPVPPPEPEERPVESVGVAADSVPPGPSAASAPDPARGPDAEGSVLVVDDEPSARLLLRTLLERRGYVVAEARDGMEALEAVGDGSGIGLVVADLNMPRMDGLELIWEIRDVHPSARLPVIVVTGEADEILETQLMEEGADDYIRKPIDPRLFLARVESTVRRLGARVARHPPAPETG